MRRRQLLLLMLIMAMLPAALFAETRSFLGTRKGWVRSQEVFFDGRYKTFNLFLVIGARPTTNALNSILGWKSRTTYLEDIQKGAHFFSEQAFGAYKSVPENSRDFGNDVVHFFADPVKEIKDINILTPAAIIYRTVVNTGKMGWHGIKIVGEPLVRMGAGTLSLTAGPLIKPVTYTGVFLIFTSTAVYGYTSSAVGGAVMLGATGTVLAMDTATAPVTLAYDLSHEEPRNVQPLENTEETSEDSRPVLKISVIP